MTKPEKKIAKIEETFLGWEDHGIFTAWITLNYGGGVQGAGLRMLSHRPSGSKVHVGSPGGIDHLMRILEACGVDQWEKLKGRTIYAILYDGLVRGLEPLPTEGGKAFMFDDVKLWPDADK